MSPYLLSEGGADVRKMWIYPLFDSRR